MRRLIPLLLLLAASCKGEPPTSGDTFELYFLGGQSNMDGFGFVEELPPGLRGPSRNVFILHGSAAADGEGGGGMGTWEPLAPGHGMGFETDGKQSVLSDRFGPELSFGHELAAASPEKKFALVKFARGGTGLVDGASGFGSWDPDYRAGNARNQYDNALTAISHALAQRDVDGDGRLDRLVPAGIIWMQGEADAHDNESAARDYARNLARLVALLRAALHDDDLPVVIGQIKDSGDTPDTRVMKYSPQVREAQAVFVEQDRCAELVDVTNGFEFLPDGWHYTSKDYVVLGRAFAEAIRRLQRRCG